MKKLAISKDKKRKLRSIPYALAEKAFWIFILLFLSSAFLIFVFLYQPLKNKKDILINSEDIPAQFDEKTFQQVLEQWKIRQNKIKEIEQKSYPDIFSKKDSLYQNEAASFSSTSSSQTSTATMATTSNP